MSKYYKKIILSAIVIILAFPPAMFIEGAAAVGVYTGSNGQPLTSGNNSGVDTSKGATAIAGTGSTGASSASAVNDASCAPWSGVFVSCSIATFANLILTISTNILGMAGATFDYAVDYSLDMSKRLDDFKFVSNGWAVLRDVTNLAYIFILLYIAINIILGNSGYGDKSLIAKVLITAVFVNFSLFGVKVIVDATNIAALQFYNLITPASSSSSSVKSLTGQFMNLFNLQSIYGSGGVSASTKSVLTSVNNAANGTSDAFGQSETWWRIAKLAALGTIFVLAVTVVLFAGAFLFISRTIVIFFLMLFASLAVASRALPSTKDKFDGWLKKLINNAIFAPIFMGLIYIFVSATNKVVGSSQVDFSSLILNGAGISGLVTFFMYLAFLVGIMLVAKQLGIKGGDTAHGIMNKWFSPKAVGSYVGNKALGVSKSIGKGALVRTVGATATGIAESGLVKGTLGRVPGLGVVLAKVGEKTGYNDLRKKREQGSQTRFDYLSTASPQKRWETDQEYKNRQGTAAKRGLSSIGLDEKGERKTGLVSRATDLVTKSLLGGDVYKKMQTTKAKEAKSKEKTKERKAGIKMAIWNGMDNLTGNDLKKRTTGGVIELDSKGNPILDEEAAYRIYNALEKKSPMTISAGPRAGTWVVTIPSTTAGVPDVVLTSSGLDNAINSSGAIPRSPTFNQDVSNANEFKQEVKEILSKATSLKNILENEAADAGK